MSEERLVQLVIDYFESEPESLKYPGIGDEEPLWALLEEIERYRPGWIDELGRKGALR